MTGKIQLTEKMKYTGIVMNICCQHSEITQIATVLNQIHDKVSKEVTIY